MVALRGRSGCPLFAPPADVSPRRIRSPRRVREPFLEASGDAGSPHKGAISYSGSGGSPIFGGGGVEYRLRP